MHENAAEDKKRPDLEILVGPRRFLVDVSVVNPAAASYALKASTERLSAAAARETVKERKYESMAAEAKAEFFPFVVESVGGFGEKATAFVEQLVKATIDSHSAWCPHEVVYGIHRVVAIAVQRGNALMASAAMSRRPVARPDRRQD